jgi:hypothetical protein
MIFSQAGISKLVNLARQLGQSAKVSTIVAPFCWQAAHGDGIGGRTSVMAFPTCSPYTCKSVLRD